MFSFVEPSAPPVDEHERLLAIEEEILQGLGIPYRVVNIAVDDLGSSATKKYDLEAWLPSQQRYPRADLDLEHDRLPVAPARHPLSAGRRQAGARAHAERHRGGGRAHVDRVDGEPPGRLTASSCRTCCGSGARLSGWVDLEGAANVRDLGGLPVPGGGSPPPACCCARTTCRALTAGDVERLVDELRRPRRRRSAHGRGGRARRPRAAGRRRADRDPPPLAVPREGRADRRR